MYKPSFGFLTDYYRREYILSNLNIDAFKEEHIMSLNHKVNTTNKLYFWQLYSILGEERIHNFIQKFYENIFNDLNDVYFSNTFKKLGTIQYHIFGQQNFWLDIMGGGKKYAGGEFRLKRHHDLAKDIMNKKGANRWLYHMEKTLNNQLLDLTNDYRVKFCIVDFIHFFMKKYAEQYNFVFKSSL